MRKGNRIYGIITVLLLSLGACSLIHDDMEELGYREDGSAYAYVSLTIHTGTAGNVTRANPTGGETGDGYEDGQTYENAVKDLTLFFYPATLGDGGVNRNGDIEFTAKVFITNPDPIDKTFTVGPVKVNGLKMNQQYHVLAVANAGNQTDIASLEALRSETVSTVYTATTTDNKTSYSNFVMASEGDEHPVLEISYENSETNPAETTIDLERLVARVDYQVKGSYETTTDDANEIEGTVTIESAALVNDFRGVTYFLKRTGSSVDASSDVTYLGDETLNPANWVVDAYSTALKNSGLYRNYFTSFTSQSGWESLLKKGDEIKDSKKQTWYRIGYTMENTNQVQSESDLENYCTGMVFKAKFVPINLDGYTGGTFYRYKNTLYKSISDLQSRIPNLTEGNCHEYGVDVYKDGYCYYTWWIKHNNDDNEAAFGPMEYAIVRNNIYQLKVTSIAGLGESEPGKSGNIVVIVAVQNWTMLPPEELPLT